MTWVNLSFPFKSTLSALKMQQLQDNFTAIVEGHAGAPRIEDASLPLPFTNVFLNTNTASSAGTLAISAQVNLTFNAYSFFPSFTQQARGAYDDYIQLGFSTSLGSAPRADAPRLAIRNQSTSGSNTYNVSHRYIEE